MMGAARGSCRAVSGDDVACGEPAAFMARCRSCAGQCPLCAVHVMGVSSIPEAATCGECGAEAKVEVALITIV